MSSLFSLIVIWLKLCNSFIVTDVLFDWYKGQAGPNKIYYIAIDPHSSNHCFCHLRIGLVLSPASNPCISCEYHEQFFRYNLYPFYTKEYSPKAICPGAAGWKILWKATLKILFSKSKGNCHKKLCLAAHKLLLLKSCYEECLSCVITILVVCISAPLAKNLHPTQFPLWLYYQKTPVQASDQNTSFYMYNQKDN